MERLFLFWRASPEAAILKLLAVPLPPNLFCYPYEPIVVHLVRDQRMFDSVSRSCSSIPDRPFDGTKPRIDSRRRFQNRNPAHSFESMFCLPWPG